MEFINSFLFFWNKFKALKKRQMLLQVVSLGLLLSGALVVYKICILISNSESPVVVVLTGSMEPSINRGDLLMLTNSESAPLVSGDIVVYKIPGKEIPIVHRVIKVHESSHNHLKILSKGDNNMVDDRGLYGPNRDWLVRHLIIGKVFGFLPYAGMLTILMNDYPQLKYAVLGGLSILALISGEQ